MVVVGQRGCRGGRPETQRVPRHGNYRASTTVQQCAGRRRPLQSTASPKSHCSRVHPRVVVQWTRPPQPSTMQVHLKGERFMDTREELRDELIAILGATRELPADTDRYLAETFLDRVDARAVRRSRRSHSRVRRSRNPRRTAATLLVGGLALLLGTFVTFNDNQNTTPVRSSVAVASHPACGWQGQESSFDSLRTLRKWEEGQNPKTFQVLGQSVDRHGAATAFVQYWECR